MISLKRVGMVTVNRLMHTRFFFLCIEKNEERKLKCSKVLLNPVVHFF